MKVRVCIFAAALAALAPDFAVDLGDTFLNDKDLETPEAVVDAIAFQQVPYLSALARTAPLDLTNVAARAVSRFSLAAREKRVEIRLEQAGAATAVIDEDRVLQVLDNLLSNAVRHTPEGSTVVVRIAAEADAVRLEVANDGAPIPDEHLPRLFEPFFRSDPSRSRRSGGSGLGLTVVKAITSAHGGTCGARTMLQWDHSGFSVDGRTRGGGLRGNLAEKQAVAK